ncbi:MAG: glycosyltransferase, partial [Acetobacteraceae bacterium]
MASRSVRSSSAVCRRPIVPPPFKMVVFANHISAVKNKPGMSLSVVIPTLNEAASLPATLGAVGASPDEVLVVDGGSDDGTAAVARAAGARV